MVAGEVGVARRGSFRADLLAASLHVAPVALGMVSLGLAFGLLLTQLGLPWWWAPIFSTVVYAGSLEFLLATMVVAAVPLAQIVVATLFVNSRHIFYAFSFPLHQVHHPLGKVYSAYALTDEAYALTASGQVGAWSGRRLLLLQLLLQLGWVGGATGGALLGLALPLEAVSGFDFALTALFIVLAMDAYRANPNLSLLLAAAGCGVGAIFFFPGQMLLVAYCAFFVLLLGWYAAKKNLRGKRRA